jgi:GNAT superfamily N-acetyltransferase
LTSWRITHDLSGPERARVHRWLAEETYWALGLPRDVFERSVDGSLCFCLRDNEDVLRGFARVITDRATFAYICDVFVDAAVRGSGAGKALVGAVMAHPDLQGLRRWMLATRDAHGLYARFGFASVDEPERLMARLDPDIYIRHGEQGP